MGLKPPKLEQRYPCPCGGADDYCDCQDLYPALRPVGAEELLQWMTYYHLPLQIWREEDDGSWVVVDGSTETVVASGGSALEALRAAHRGARDA